MDKIKVLKIYGMAIFWAMIYLGMYAGGIATGMLLQQTLTQATLVKFGQSLEGTTFNLEIDINETILVDTFYKNMEEEGVFNLTNTTNNKES